ncbi:MAG: hypothetical protein C0446_08295 [Chitinophaga sp.]|nr:hypothetical protein [Chitinophaga sp.]
MNQDMKLVGKVLNRFEKLQHTRNNYVKTWDEITTFFMPSRGQYASTAVTKGENKAAKLLDITGVIAARTLASRIYTELTNPGDKWFKLTPKDNSVLSDNALRFTQKLEDTIFTILQDDWRLAHIEATHDWIAYGTACMMVHEYENEKTNEKELCFKAIPVAELFIAEDFRGKVDTVFRKLKIPLRQIAQQFGTDNFETDLLRELENDPDAEFEVVHAVFPNEDYIPGGKMKGRMKFTSTYILLDKNLLLSSGGFKHMPYIVFRCWKRSGEVYGGSPAWDALPDVKMINAMVEAAIRTRQLAAQPPILTAADGVVLPLKMTPNGVNIGGISPEGRRLIEPFISGSNVNQAEEGIETRRMSVRHAFFVDPLINRENSIRTAAEVQKRASEELNGIAPIINRFEKEYLEQLVERVMMFLLDNIPDKSIIPEELQGSDIKIEYSAPLSRTHKAKQLESTMTFLQLVQTVAAADPSVMKTIKSDGLMNMLVDLLNVPYDIVKSQEELAMEKQQAMQQQMLAQLTETAPALSQTVNQTSGALKNLAETAQLGLGGPGQLV